MLVVAVIVIVLVAVLLLAMLLAAGRRAAGHTAAVDYEDQPVRSHAEASRRAPDRGRP